MHGTTYCLAAENEIVQKGMDLWLVDSNKILDQKRVHLCAVLLLYEHQ
jgi:hypothetical protein